MENLANENPKVKAKVFSVGRSYEDRNQSAIEVKLLLYSNREVFI